MLELRAIFFLDFEGQTFRINDPIIDISIPLDFDPLTGGLVESGITKIEGMRVSIIETTEPIVFLALILKPSNSSPSESKNDRKGLQMNHRPPIHQFFCVEFSCLPDVLKGQRQSAHQSFLH